MNMSHGAANFRQYKAVSPDGQADGKFAGGGRAQDLQAVDTDALGAPVTIFAYIETIKVGYKKAGVHALSGILFLPLLIFRRALS